VSCKCLALKHGGAKMDIKGIGNSGYDYIKSEPIKTENTQVAD